MRWPPAAHVHLPGHVVELTPINPARDAAVIFAALDDDRVWEHVTDRPTSADAFAEQLERELTAGEFPWLVRLRVCHDDLPAGEVVGISSYADISVADARLEIGGTAFTPKVWGSAINVDSKRVLFAHAFEVLGAARIQLKTDVRNGRSRAAIARLGAQYEGTLRCYGRRPDGTIRDTAVFAVTAYDWPAVKTGLEQRVASLSSPSPP